MTATELVARYQSLGFKLICWPRIGDDPKEWKGPREAGWNDPKREFDADKFDPERMNVGVMTGCELEAGWYLADVDLDWAPGLVLASRLLPSTGFGFGRKGKKLSHAFYATPEPMPIAAYDDVEDGTQGERVRFVELRSGTNTHQTMIAPSLHSPGVFVELVLDGNILKLQCKQLQVGVLDYAIACLVFKRVPNGLHHDGRIALAGLLLNHGVSPERTIAIMEAICQAQAASGVPDMSAKDVTDAELVVRTTQQRVAANQKVAGGPKFAEFVGGDVGRAVVARLMNWLGGADEWERDGKGHIIPKSQKNIQRALCEELKYTLSYNQFSAQVLMNGVPLEKKAAHQAYLELEAKCRFSPPLEYFRIVLENLCWQNQFHPVRQYLEGLTWDGQPRLDAWLINAAKAEDSAYVRAVSAIMPIAGVRRVLQPGCKYDEMMVWESAQGGLKSSAAQALCPRPEWFSDDLQLNVRSQQLIEATLGKWIVEASDLAGKRKTEIEQLKAMLSRQVDGPARMAYEYFPVERPRHFILIGTTNSSVYLNDPTGARRFWPVPVRRFDVAWIVQNRDQLWAEAKHREARGESIRLPEALWPEAAKHQEQRREIDPWEETLLGVLDGIPPSGDGLKRVATDALWVALGIATDKRDRYGQLRIADVMQRLGYHRTRVRVNGGPTQVGYAGGKADEDDAERHRTVDEVVGTPEGEKDVPF